MIVIARVIEPKRFLTYYSVSMSTAVPAHDLAVKADVDLPSGVFTIEARQCFRAHPAHPLHGNARNVISLVAS